MLCDGVRTNPPNAMDCGGYRLPTGAEWEYAARAGTRTSVYAGEVIERADMLLCVDDPVLSPIAWYCANAGNTSHPVGQKQPNAFGLYDMIGNASEWAGSIIEHYAGGPHTDWGAQIALENLNAEVVLVQRRSGIFYSKPSGLRSAAVGGYTPSARFPAYSFRLVHTLPPGE